MQFKINLRNYKNEECNLNDMLKRKKEEIEEFKDNLFKVSKNINSIN